MKLGKRGFRSCIRVELLPKAVPKAHRSWQDDTLLFLIEQQKYLSSMSCRLLALELKSETALIPRMSRNMQIFVIKSHI